MRNFATLSVLSACFVASCAKPTLGVDQLAGTWKISETDSKLPRADLKLPVIEITFSAKGYKSAGLETTGKWSVADNKLTLHPAAKAPVLEYVDTGKISQDKAAHPITFLVRNNDTQLVWSPQGGSGNVKPVYVFEKELARG